MTTTTDKILKEMDDMKKGGEGSGKKGHKTSPIYGYFETTRMHPNEYEAVREVERRKARKS